MPVGHQPLECLFNDPAVDVAGQVPTNVRPEQRLEAYPASVRSTHPQQDFEPRVGGRRTQRQDGLRQEFERLGGERRADWSGKTDGRTILARALFIAVNFDPVASARLGGPASELGIGHRLAEAPIAVAEPRNSDTE